MVWTPQQRSAGTRLCRVFVAAVFASTVLASGGAAGHAASARPHTSKDATPRVIARITTGRFSRPCAPALHRGSIWVSAFGTGSVVRINPRRNRRSEEHTSELQSHHDLVCRLLL